MPNSLQTLQKYKFDMYKFDLSYLIQMSDLNKKVFTCKLTGKKSNLFLIHLFQVASLCLEKEKNLLVKQVYNYKQQQQKYQADLKEYLHENCLKSGFSFRRCALLSV